MAVLCDVPLSDDLRTGPLTVAVPDDDLGSGRCSRVWDPVTCSEV